MDPATILMIALMAGGGWIGARVPRSIIAAAVTATVVPGAYAMAALF